MRCFERSQIHRFFVHHHFDTDWSYCSDIQTFEVLVRDLEVSKNSFPVPDFGTNESSSSNSTADSDSLADHSSSSGIVAAVGSALSAVGSGIAHTLSNL